MVKIKNYSWNEILSLKKNIVFWGYGKVFRNFVLEHVDWYKSTSFIIDNDYSKQGVLKSPKGEIPVISFEKFISWYEKNQYLIIISLGKELIEPVLNMLDHIAAMNDQLICISKLIDVLENYNREKGREYPISFRISANQLIPKKIHYCWFGGSDIPEQNVNWMNSWKKYCPDYEIVRWDESNYDIKKNKFTFEAYKAKKWGFVPDYARLDIIYNEGGIYLDTDVEIIKPLDDLLYQKAFFGVEIDKYINPGSGFGASKHNRIIKELAMQYDNIGFDKNKMVPSPKYLQKFFAKHGWKQDGNYYACDDFTILPEKILSPIFDSSISEVFTIPQTYAIHHYDASWYDQEKKELRKKNKLFFNSILQRISQESKKEES